MRFWLSKLHTAEFFITLPFVQQKVTMGKFLEAVLYQFQKKTSTHQLSESESVACCLS